LQNLVIGDFGKVRLADNKTLDVTGMGDIVLKTPVDFWTLKDVRVVPSLAKSLIYVRQLDEQEHGVKFGNQQWKVVKRNLVMVRGRKRGSLYMVRLPSEGVIVPIRKINKVQFTESRGQKRVVFTRDKLIATGQIQDERAWKGSGRPIKGTYSSGSTGPAPIEVPKRKWVRRTSIPAVETSPENFLLSMEYVCSQAIPGSDNSCKWESVGTEDGLMTVSVMTNRLKL